MSITHQAPQCLLYSRERVGILLCAIIQVAKVDTKMQAAIFLLHQHHSVAPCTLAGSDGTRFQHFLQVTPDLLNQWWWNPSKSFFKGVSSVTFIIWSMEWVQPNSAGSNEKTSWYLARSWQAASASSGLQESRPLKSNLSNNFPMSLPNCKPRGVGIVGLLSHP